MRKGRSGAARGRNNVVPIGVEIKMVNAMYQHYRVCSIILMRTFKRSAYYNLFGTAGKMSSYTSPLLLHRMVRIKKDTRTINYQFHTFLFPLNIFWIPVCGKKANTLVFYNYFFLILF